MKYHYFHSHYSNSIPNYIPTPFHRILEVMSYNLPCKIPFFNRVLGLAQPAIVTNSDVFMVSHKPMGYHIILIPDW